VKDSARFLPLHNPLAKATLTPSLAPGTLTFVPLFPRGSSSVMRQHSAFPRSPVSDLPQAASFGPGLCPSATRRATKTNRGSFLLLSALFPLTEANWRAGRLRSYVIFSHAIPCIVELLWAFPRYGVTFCHWEPAPEEALSRLCPDCHFLNPDESITLFRFLLTCPTSGQLPLP